jgi:uncharacterized protein YcfJ
MNTSILGLILITAAILGSSGCASNQQPVLYPNAHYQAAGRPGANQAIADCTRLAKEFGLPNHQRDEIPGKAAAGAAIGAASAGAWGLVQGNAGGRALAGAAAGGAGGLVKGAFDSDTPDPTHKRFVEKCLSDRGYEVVGWR